MASVIEGFLVSLGFDIDKDELAKFNASIDGARQRFLGIGKAAIGAGAAVGAAFVKTTYDVNNLYKISNNTGSSIGGLLKLQGAVARVGGSAENVTSALNNFALKSKTFGEGFDRQVMQLVGVPLRDATGAGRDMSEVLIDISKALAKTAKTDPGLARMKAEAMGLGDIFDDLVKKDFPKELERSARFSDLFGKEIDKGADSSHRLANELSQIWDTVAMGAQSATSQITDVLKLDEKLASFNDSFADGLQNLIDSQVAMLRDSTGVFDFFQKFFTKQGDYQADARIKTLEARASSGKATKAEQDELAELKSEKKENAVADDFHVDRDTAKRMGLADIADDDTKLKAQIFDVDESDVEGMKALKDRKVTTEDLARFDENGEDPDAVKAALVLKLLARQREQEKQQAEQAAKAAAAVPSTAAVEAPAPELSGTAQLLERERAKPADKQVKPKVGGPAPVWQPMPGETSSAPRDKSKPAEYRAFPGEMPAELHKKGDPVEWKAFPGEMTSAPRDKSKPAEWRPMPGEFTSAPRDKSKPAEWTPFPGESTSAPRDKSKPAEWRAFPGEMTSAPRDKSKPAEWQAFPGEMTSAPRDKSKPAEWRAFPGELTSGPRDKSKPAEWAPFPGESTSAPRDKSKPAEWVPFPGEAPSAPGKRGEMRGPAFPGEAPYVPHERGVPRGPEFPDNRASDKLTAAELKALHDSVDARLEQALKQSAATEARLVDVAEAAREGQSLPLQASGPAASEASAVADATQAAPVTNNVDNSRTSNSASQVTINQQISITGAGDPAAVGKSIAKETSQLSRQTRRGVC